MNRYNQTMPPKMQGMMGGRQPMAGQQMPMRKPMARGMMAQSMMRRLAKNR